MKRTYHKIERGKTDRRKESTDHKGNRFASIEDMCRFWGVTPTAFSRRVNYYKWDIKRALTTPVKHNGGIRCCDHEGRQFRSISRMCDHYGIYRKTFQFRMEQGWPLKDALLTPAADRQRRGEA